MIDVLFVKKRIGVNVKGELRLHESIFLVMLVILYVCLFKMDLTDKVERKESSTANYLEVDNLASYNKKDKDSIINEYYKIKEEVEENFIVYDGMTIDELANKLNKSLNSTISDKGYLIATHSIEKGVDPYMATAIILQETGCKWECSYLVKACNNVGGQKGVGCGSYSSFPTLDDGIKAFINNLADNYIKHGLETPEEINPSYAEDRNWSVNVNKYIESIKAQ